VIADASGRIDQILFETVQRVEQGQPLVRLDRGIQQANLAGAEAELADIRVQLDRARQLVTSRAVSEARVDELEAAFLAAEARVTTNAPFRSWDRCRWFWQAAPAPKAASLLTLVVTPVLYDLLARFTRPANAVAEELSGQLRVVRQTRHQPAE
jgi:multidrug efflux pump subunit AcrA (membrane-fusion protein)